MDSIAITALSLIGFVAVRNVMVGIWQLRAIHEAHELNVADINALRGQELMLFDPEARYASIPSYLSQLLDLTQWRYRSPFA